MSTTHQHVVQHVYGLQTPTPFQLGCCQCTRSTNWRSGQRIERWFNCALAQRGRRCQHQNASAPAAGTLCRQATWRLQGKFNGLPTGASPIHGGSSRDPDTKKTVGLKAELKLNQPSSCDETNQAAGLAIGGAGGCLPLQRAGTHSRVFWRNGYRRLPRCTTRSLLQSLHLAAETTVCEPYVTMVQCHFDHQ